MKFITPDSSSSHVLCSAGIQTVITRMVERTYCQVLASKLVVIRSNDYQVIFPPHHILDVIPWVAVCDGTGQSEGTPVYCIPRTTLFNFGARRV